MDWTLPASAGGVRQSEDPLGYPPRVVEPEEQVLASASAAPPVVAVVVTHDAPAQRLDQLLTALVDQDHADLSVLVIDTGSDTGTSAENHTGSHTGSHTGNGDSGDVAERVRCVLPDARVERVPGNPGFGAAANRVLDPGRPRARRAEYIVFCHDDVVPDAGAVRCLVDAATEWDADVVGAKLVDWDDPRRLQRVGLAVDRLGTTLPLVERGELDQGQHDGVREVFAVPGGFTLVRASRFAEIGGFDEAITFLGDDVDLCWRSRVAGSRVLVAPDARVRHAEAFNERPDERRRARLVARHRLRTLLSCSGRLDLLRVLPLALAATALQAAGGLVIGRPGRSRAALGAWTWNLARPLSLWRARRRARRTRRASPRAVRSMQVLGRARARMRLQRLAHRQGIASATRAASDETTSDEAAPPVVTGGEGADDRAAWTPATVMLAAVLAGVVLFGSRHLLTRFVPAVGELVSFRGGAGGLVGEWASGWRPVGLGSETSAPTIVGVAGALGALLGDHLGLARTLLTVGLVPVGILGAHRLLRPTGSKAAQVAAAVAYAAVPLPYDGLATGRWSVVAAYAASPWMVGRLARASGVAPFSVDGPDPIARRRLWQHVVAAGTVTAVGGLLVPQAPALLVAMGAALIVGTLLAFQVRGIGRLLAVSLGGAAVAAGLHLPAVVDLVRSRTAAEAWMGLDRLPGSLSAADLLRFDTGPVGMPELGYLLAGAAALPLLVGRDWRLAWAVRGWVLAVATWGVVWAQQEGHLAVRLPDPGVVLAPGAVGLALAAALGVAAIDADVRGRSWRFGIRRIVSGVCVLALAGATAPVVVASMDGWWEMPHGDLDGVLGFVDQAVAEVPSRVLWVGDPSLVPAGAGWQLDGGLSFTTSQSATPGLEALWPATGIGSTGRIGDALELAVGHRTSRLGRVLAPMGVQYIAVPTALGPSSASPTSSPGTAVPAGAVADLRAALDEQLDLEQVAVDDAVALYRNVGFAPLRSVGVSAEAQREASVAGMQHIDVIGFPVLTDGEPDGRAARGEVPPRLVLVQAASASDRWRLEIDGRTAPRRDAYGWADAFDTGTGGAAVLRYHTPTMYHVLLGAQAVLWLVALAVAARMRFGPDAPPPPPRPGSLAASGEPSAGAALDAAGTDAAAAGDGDQSEARPVSPDGTPAPDEAPLPNPDPEPGEAPVPDGEPEPGETPDPAREPHPVSSTGASP
jgi:GT2 family glycosyltransferase